MNGYNLTVGAAVGLAVEVGRGVNVGARVETGVGGLQPPPHPSVSQPEESGALAQIYMIEVLQ